MPPELHLLRPAWLLMLIPLALGLWRLARRGNAGTAWQGLVDAHLLPHLLVGRDGQVRRLPLLLLSVAGVIGTLQAVEVLKLITGTGEPLIGRLLVYDALAMEFRRFNVPKDPDCPVCGPSPTITEPIEVAAGSHLGISSIRFSKVRVKGS